MLILECGLLLLTVVLMCAPLWASLFSKAEPWTQDAENVKSDVCMAQMGAVLSFIAWLIVFVGNRPC